MMPALFRAAACALALCAVHADAQFLPSRPLRFIVTYPPGALNDLLARTLSPRLSEQWAQQVVVDNRPGGSTPDEFAAHSKAEIAR